MSLLHTTLTYLPKNDPWAYDRFKKTAITTSKDFRRRSAKSINGSAPRLPRKLKKRLIIETTLIALISNILNTYRKGSSS